MVSTREYERSIMFTEDFELNTYHKFRCSGIIFLTQHIRTSINCFLKERDTEMVFIQNAIVYFTRVGRLYVGNSEIRATRTAAVQQG